MPIIHEGLSAPELGRSIGQWVKEHTITVAERVLREEVRRGFDSQPVVVTDGMPRRDYLQVKPFGRIEFAARTSMAEAVRWALTELQKKSPVLTGRYASSHTVMINGAEVQGNIWVALRNVRPTDRIQIVNPQGQRTGAGGGAGPPEAGPRGDAGREVHGAHRAHAAGTQATAGSCFLVIEHDNDTR